MSRFVQRSGFTVVIVLLLINQFLRHIQSHTHQFLKFHLHFQGVVEQEVDGIVMLSHGNPLEIANIILPDMFDELYSWSLQIQHLPDEQHWMLLDLPIVQSEEQEQIEVEAVGQALIGAWNSHPKGVERLISHGTSAVLALEAVNNNPEYIQKLMLINPLLPGFFPDVSQILPQSRADASERFLQYSGGQGYFLPDTLLGSWVSHYQQPAYKKLLLALKAHGLNTMTHNVDVEIIWSEPNPYGSIKLKQQLEILFPNAEWHLLLDCGFAPHYRCNDKLTELLIQ
ncbi:MAG: hypothetical protein ACON4U_18760 [Myxococcota bacterium]